MESEIAETINTVADFLGKERTDELKDYIVEQLKENLYQSINDHWIVFPTHFNEMFEEMFDSCKNSLMKTYKKTLTEAMSEKVEEYLETLKKTTVGKETD